VLSDRTLIITGVTKHPGPAHGTVLIDLNLVVRNTSGRPIKNMPAFFRLIGPEGDSFNYQYKSSDNFYRPVGARTSRAGLTKVRDTRRGRGEPIPAGPSAGPPGRRRRPRRRRGW
jgi:hypothetical protein